MKTSPVFVFDLGKVLVDFDYSVAARKIAARSVKSLREINTFLENSPLLVEYESGRIDRQTFYDSVRHAVGFQGDLEEFGGFFADIFTEMPDTIALHAELRRHHFKTYIFSNTNDLAVEHVRRNFPFFAHFDGYILSYEIGTMKPFAAIYDAMEQLTGRNGADLIYFDDRAENVAAALARGWRGLVHESGVKTRTELVRLGLLPRQPAETAA
jgi:FMN phosphatase YigB (HAD superfamily)